MSLHPYGVTRVETGQNRKRLNVACLIIGIDGWERYTLPLIQSIAQHEPTAQRIVVDNASVEPYPASSLRTERLCYSAAINAAHDYADPADWYVVLSNDVLCTGPFVDQLAALPDNCIAGPDLKHTHGWRYLEGWCVAIPRRVWEALGGWDERYQVSSWEDVDLSASAVEHGFRIAHVPSFPFRHLDQRQRFTLIDNYWDSETHNARYFFEKRQRAQQEKHGA